MSAPLPAYLVKANEFVFEIDHADLQAASLVQKTPSVFHLIHQNRSVTAELLETDSAGKLWRIEIEGQTFEVEVKDTLDQMLENMGFNKVAGKHIKELKAPMPGLVLSIAVTEGQQVQEGDRILILEAMKMENSILIPADATIKRIVVKPGQAVEKGQVLVALD
jgi:biotin carboxyl carrier protein